MAYKAKQALFEGSLNGSTVTIGQKSPTGRQHNQIPSQADAPELPARNLARPQTEAVSPPPLPSRQLAMAPNTRSPSLSLQQHSAPSLPSRNPSRNAVPIRSSIPLTPPYKASPSPAPSVQEPRPSLSGPATEQPPPLPSRHAAGVLITAPRPRTPLPSPPPVQAQNVTGPPAARPPPAIGHRSRNMALPPLPADDVIHPSVTRPLLAEPRQVAEDPTLPTRDIAHQPSTRPPRHTQKAVPPLSCHAVTDTAATQASIQAAQTHTAQPCPSNTAKDPPPVPALSQPISLLQESGPPLPPFPVTTHPPALPESRTHPTAASVTTHDGAVAQISGNNDNSVQRTSAGIHEDLESRFRFVDVNKCPAPERFERGPKTYESKSRRSAAGASVKNKSPRDVPHDESLHPLPSESEHDTHQSDDSGIHPRHRPHQLNTTPTISRCGRLPGVSLSPPAAEQDEILQRKTVSPQSGTKVLGHAHSEPLPPQSHPQHEGDAHHGYGSLRNPHRDPLPPPPPSSLGSDDIVSSDHIVTQGRRGSIKTLLDNSSTVQADQTNTSNTGSSGDTDTDYTHIVCPICMDMRREIASAGGQLASTPCGHVFCLACITAVITSQGRCPTCRKKLTQKQIITLYM